MSGIVAMYLRKSQKDMELESYGEMETLAKHEQLLTELAKKQGLRVAKIYKEIVSGESIDDRPQMQALLNDIYQNKYDGVLVAEVERLARGATLDQGKVANAFKYTNTKIITPIKTYDPNNEYDEEYFEFSLFMSRKEFKTINRRMQQGKMLSVKNGNYLGVHAPLGYDIVKKGRERTLVPNDTAEIVKLIYKWFLEERLSPFQIAKRLTEMGYQTVRGGREWNKNYIWEILRNDLYRGKIRWNYRKVYREYKDDKLVKSIRRTKKGEAMIVDGKHEALISEEDFQRAQEILNIRSTPTNAHNGLKSPLAGIVKCKKCGKSMVRYVHKNARTRLTHYHSITCKVKSTYFDEAYDSIIAGLENHVKEFEFKMTNDYELQEAQQRVKHLDLLERELAETYRQRKEIFTFFERKLYTEDEFLERKAISNDRIKELEATIEELRRNTTTSVDYSEKIVKFSHVIEALRDDEVSVVDKNNLLKDIIERIDYTHENGKVTLDIILR